MPAPHDHPSSPLPSAEAKFAEFLRQKNEGRAVSLEDLCARYPDEETALRMLHSIYEEGKSSADAPGNADLHRLSH